MRLDIEVQWARIGLGVQFPQLQMAVQMPRLELSTLPPAVQLSLSLPRVRLDHRAVRAELGLASAMDLAKSYQQRSQSVPPRAIPKIAQQGDAMARVEQQPAEPPAAAIIEQARAAGVQQAELNVTARPVSRVGIEVEPGVVQATFEPGHVEGHFLPGAVDLHLRPGSVKAYLIQRAQVHIDLLG